MWSLLSEILLSLVEEYSSSIQNIVILKVACKIKKIIAMDDVTNKWRDIIEIKETNKA